MSLKPKKGTIERIVLDKLREAGTKGVTHFDFTDPPISESRLAEAIANLQNGMYESEEAGGKDGWH